MLRSRLYLPLAISVLCVTSVAHSDPPASQPADRAIYRCTLESPGGELPFLMELSGNKNEPEGWIINGSERIVLPKVMRFREEGRVGFLFPHYDSVIEATFDRAANTMRGTWTKRSSKDQQSQMPFAAEAYQGFRFKPIVKMTMEITPQFPIAGRWSVQFASDKEPCVGVFTAGSGKDVEGTFLTTTGDYRFLAGTYEFGQLRLSCFDGAHAFLFHARMQMDGTLTGEFWSGPKGHDTWTAKRDDKAALPDGFSLTKPSAKPNVKDLHFPDLNGKDQPLGPILGKCTLVEIFGSWCPNCHDAADVLLVLQQRHGQEGLRILGLAFESGDAERDARQVKRYLARHEANYPVLIAGVRDPKKASAALPVIDGIKGYPSFLFVDEKGDVRAVYTGFSGPATGDEYKKLARQFDQTIVELLGNKK